MTAPAAPEVATSWTPAGPTLPRPPVVVVGVTDSADSVAALRAAGAAARRLGADLRVVSTWQYPGLYSSDSLPLHRELARAAAAAQQGSITRAFPEGYSDTIHAIVRDAPQAATLVDESATADLLMIGRSDADHPGRLSGLARACLTQAECSVQVVTARAR